MQSNRLMRLLACTAALAVAPAAQAAVVICTTPNCAPTDQNVLVNAATGVSTATGETNQTNTAVTFTSPIGELLTAGANGQARIEGTDGLLNGLTITLVGDTFGSAVFNLPGAPGNVAGEATSILLSYVLSDGTTGSQPFTVNTGGQNFFGIFGTAGERFTSISFVGDPNTTGVGDLRQLRLGGVGLASGVPEPGTWLLMMLGIGAVGLGLRKRRNGEGADARAVGFVPAGS